MELKEVINNLDEKIKNKEDEILKLQESISIKEKDNAELKAEIERLKSEIVKMQESLAANEKMIKISAWEYFEMKAKEKNLSEALLEKSKSRVGLLSDKLEIEKEVEMLRNLQESIKKELSKEQLPPANIRPEKSVKNKFAGIASESYIKKLN